MRKRQKKETLRTYLKRMRARRKLSLRAVARNAGIDHSVLIRIESGAARPCLSTLHKLYPALGLDLKGIERFKAEIY